MAVENQYYYPRGPLDFKWNTNYGRFSKVYYEHLWNGKDQLLNDPDFVSQSGLKAF